MAIITNIVRCIYPENAKKKKKPLRTLFMDGVKVSKGYSHFEEAVYFLPFSPQTFLVLTLSTSKD